MDVQKTKKYGSTDKLKLEQERAWENSLSSRVATFK